MKKIENQKTLKSFFQNKNFLGEFILPYFMDTGEGFGPGYLLISSIKYPTTSGGNTHSVSIQELKLTKNKVEQLCKSQDHRLSIFEKNIYGFIYLNKKGKGTPKNTELILTTKCGPFHSGLCQSQPGLLMGLYKGLNDKLSEVQSWVTGSEIFVSGLSEGKADELLDLVRQYFEGNILEAEGKFNYLFTAW